MKKKCTTKDIAKELGIAQSTVSRVLNNSPSASVVSEKTRKKIMETVKRLGYVPNVNAKRLVQNKSNVIGVVLPDPHSAGEGGALSDPSVSKIAGGMESVLRDKGCRMLLIFNDERFVSSRDFIYCLESKTVDGLVVWGARNNDSYWNEVADLNVVMINSRNQPHCAIDYIGHDNFNATYELTKKMIVAGRRRIAFFDVFQELSISEERFAGYQQALIDLDVKFDEKLCFTGNCFDVSLKNMMKLLHHIPDAFDAIQCINDALALGVGTALLKMGLNIPNDIMLAGGDRIGDSYLPMQLWPFPILSFTPSCYEMGRMAAEWVLGRVEEDENRKTKGPRQHLFSVKFIDS